MFSPRSRVSVGVAPESTHWTRAILGSPAIGVMATQDQAPYAGPVAVAKFVKPGLVTTTTRSAVPPASTTGTAAFIGRPGLSGRGVRFMFPTRATTSLAGVGSWVGSGVGDDVGEPP